MENKLAFAVEEYHRRMRITQEKVRELGLDALLCHSFANICYLSGLQSVMGTEKYFMLVVPAKGEPTLMGQSFELYNALHGCWIEDRVGFNLFDDPIDASRTLLRERGFASGRLGLEYGLRGLTPRALHDLTHALPGVRFEDASDVVVALRGIKSPAEVAVIREAARLTSEAMDRAVGQAEMGHTDSDIAASAMEHCVRQGGEFFCLEPIISLGSRSGVPHCTFGHNPIRQGDLCFIEIGACKHRYSAALIRTVSFGKPPAFQQRICDEIEASLNKVIEHLKPGVPIRDVALKARSAWEWTFTHPELFWNGAYGYSIGLGFPSEWGDADLLIREEAVEVLQPGMVFHCTNNIRKGGVFGMGISETVAITDTGNEVLTDYPRRLIIK